MNKPHKHAEVIKAWADGALIECRLNKYTDWASAGTCPSWFQDCEYRIKPELKDPGIVCRNAFYKAVYPDNSPKSIESKEWTAAAKAVIEAYKAEELKDI